MRLCYLFGKSTVRSYLFAIRRKISCGRGYERAFGYLSGKTAKKASYTIHIEVPPNPFWASIGLTVTPLPVGSGTQYKSEVSLGYLNQSFQNAVMEGVRYGMEQGLYGWGVTDCQICFDYGVYYSPVSTPADFRFLAPVVLEQALKKAGTQLLEPYLSFTLLHRRNIFHGLIMTHQSIAQSLNQPDLKR